MKKAIEIKNLKKYYKDVKAVDDVSFSVEEGELFAFLGLNGAGKSTTINIICNAVEKDGGTVLVEGLSVDENMSEIYPLLGVVFQNSVLDPKLTVYDNLKCRAALYGVRKEQFDRRLSFLCEKLELKSVLKRPLCKLSGGQRRRIDIARALINQPKILILDEPTTGLDPNTRIMVWRFISELRECNKMTVMLTTHYMEEAAQADHVVIIDNGHVVASDTPNNLKNDYANDFLKLYRYDGKIMEVLEDGGYSFKNDRGVLEITFADMEEVKRFLVENESLVTDFEAIKGNMDNVFLNVTGKRLGEGV